MLYKKSASKSLDLNLFKNPTSEYRATPFWGWNTELRKDVLMRQIDSFKQMGFGGFHIHTRSGLKTEYLGKEFMQLVRDCADKAESEDMLTWLYDEDKWPSGFAGGKVTKEKKYRRKHLRLTVTDLGECLPKEQAMDNGSPYYVTCYDIQLDKDGYLESYRRIEKDDMAVGTKWYAYVVTEENNPFYNNQAYVDTSDKEAIEKFIQCTYEPYKNTVGDKFGTTVPAIFTDEPALGVMSCHILPTPESTSDVQCIWSRDFEADYKATYAEDILDVLPLIFWNKEDRSDSLTKYRYFDISARRFANNYTKSLGDWCDANGITLTGHLSGEGRLVSQCGSCGETMRNYQYFGLPGIDILCNRREYTTAKQTQSAVHQYGKEGMMSELYGVTNWDYDFRGHKIQGDWQAALGVTLRVPHLAWVSMKGDAKRDFPAPIGYQSPWYKEYSYIEDHFARLNTALTRGTPIVKIGVIHPIESYWIMTGPQSQNSLRTESLENNFNSVVDWLLKSHLDFDYICESTIPQLENKNVPGTIGKMHYDAIVVPGCLSLRQTTIDYLEQFLNAGGKVIFMGECPKFTDGIVSDACANLYGMSACISFDRASLSESLEDVRNVTIITSTGKTASQYLYNYRQDNDCRWLFIALSADPPQPDVLPDEEITITVKGEFFPVLYDTISGEIRAMQYAHKNGNTVITQVMAACDSLLIRLGSSKVAVASERREYDTVKQYDIKRCVDYSLSEPNVLLIDRADYAFNDGEWRGEEDLLLANQAFNRYLGHTLGLPQPYVIEPEPATNHMRVRFEFESEIEYEGALLAIEDAEELDITFNGQSVDAKPVGYFTDEDIKTVPLPKIQKGINRCELIIPFGGRTRVEWCYILGDFGVRVMGCEKIITNKFDKIGFGNMATQGLPFYGANITYSIDVDMENDGAIEIEASNYRGSLISVDIDGARAGRIVLPPYNIRISDLKQGVHRVNLTLYGNRHNSFGPLHLVNEKHFWFGSNSWYTTGTNRCYEYRLKPMGILKSPVIKILREKK